MRPSRKRTRWRLTRNRRLGEWSIGIARSLWPRPHPHGMALYVAHFLWWNIVVEHDLGGRPAPSTGETE